MLLGTGRIVHQESKVQSIEKLVPELMRRRETSDITLKVFRSVSAVRLKMN